jgi:serine protease Do
MNSQDTREPLSPQTPSGRKKSALRAGTMAVAITAAVASFAVGGYVFAQRNDEAQPVVRATEAAVVQPLPPRMVEQGQPFSFADLVEHVSPAVVTVAVERQDQRPRMGQLPDNIPEPFRDFFRQFGPQGQGPGGQPQRAPRAQAMGSGFIVDPTGFVVTNNHVVQSAQKISIKLPDGREFQAKLVGTDADTDIALLKIDGVKDLPTVPFGDDRKLRVGDWVVAVGNPFGLGGTVTAGIVSSIGRDIGNGPYTDFLQIDASINQGNSGGPTFDLTGRVIGMNTAIFSPSGGSVGIGFAIPASVVQSVVDQLKTSGSVTRGWLGVQIQNLTPDMASSLGVSVVKGAIVASVIPDSPAAKAGFRQGDVVTSLNGTEIADSRDLTRKVASLRVGERGNFTILREGKPQTLTATIAKRDSAALAQNNSGETPEPQAQPQATKSSLGLSLAPLTAASRQQFNVPDTVTSGVVVITVEPDSESAQKGLSAGDVISGIGTREVKTPADIEAGIAEARKAGRDSVLLLVSSQQGQHFVALKLAN